MKNVPMILHIITDLNDGGAEGVLFRLCTGDLDHRHHVVSLMDSGKYGPLLAAHGIPVTTLGMKRGRASLVGLLRLFRVIRSVRPVAIQTWMYHADLLGGVVARLAGHRNIVWGIRNSTLVPGKSSRSTIMIARICAQLSRFVPQRIVCCAEKAREVHVALGYDRARMRVIYNGFDLSVFRPDSLARHGLRRDLALASDVPVIGYVSRFDPQKDHETLLRALAILHDQGRCPFCLLVGTNLDPSNTALTNRIAALGLSDHVYLLGRRNDIPVVMNALDLHVMSSAFGEAFPNVLAEAMACGTPCVATDVGDSATIIGNTGRIVPPRDPQALADAIRDVLPQAMDDTAQAACRDRILSNFTLDHMVREYTLVWQDSISEAEITLQ